MGVPTSPGSPRGLPDACIYKATDARICIAITSLLGRISNRRARRVLPVVPWHTAHIVSEVAQSRPTLYDPVDCSPPGSSVYGTLQARILEWGAISFARGSSQPRDQTPVSHIAGRCFNRKLPGKPAHIVGRQQMFLKFVIWETGS